MLSGMGSFFSPKQPCFLDVPPKRVAINQQNLGENRQVKSIEAPPTSVRRLNRVEYENTLHDLLRENVKVERRNSTAGTSWAGTATVEQNESTPCAEAAKRDRLCARTAVGDEVRRNRCGDLVRASSNRRILDHIGRVDQTLLG